MTHAVTAMTALAQESRLKIFRLLVTTENGDMAAGEISEKLGISPATLSFHLKELANAQLIRQRREGRSLLYGLNVETMRSLLCYLMEDCCQGKPELCQPDYGEDCCADQVSKLEPKPTK